MILRIILFAVGLLISTSGGAQHIGNVVVDVDEFTGTRSCSQFVAANRSDRTGVHMYVSGSHFGVSIWRGLDPHAAFSDSAFNLFMKFPSDRVFFRFQDGRVLEIEPDDTLNELSLTHPTEIAHIFHNRELMADLLATPGDVRVRFSGSSGHGDFTLPHAVFVALSRGFQETCSY